MGKKRALARLCEAFSLTDMLELCEAVRLQEADVRLIEQRFYRETSRELCDMPVGVQRRRVPIIEIWLVDEVLRRKDALPDWQRRRLEEALDSG